MRIAGVLATIITFSVLVIAQATEIESEANHFWRSFRQAVMNQDHARLSALTRFPFEVRGPDDSDPVKRFDRKGFKRILRRVLAQPVFVELDGKSVTKSMLEIVEEKAELKPSDYHNPSYVQVEQFEFQRINGHWAFTRAYLEE